MLRVVCRLLFGVCLLLFIVWLVGCALFVRCCFFCWLFVVRMVFVFVVCSLLVVRCVLVVVRSLLSLVVCSWSLFVVLCGVFVVWCRCSLFVVR